MLEKVDLTRQLSKEDHHEQMKKLQERLRLLQHACLDAKVATTIVLEGWDAAGKGSMVGVLVEKLDPRGFRVRATYAPLVDELYRPWLWRFWMRLPAAGEIVVFDRSWYGRVLVERIEEVATPEEVEAAFGEIDAFERNLADDGQVLVKLFLHISRKEQKKRFKKAEGDPYARWKIRPEDWRHHAQYDQIYQATEEMLERTSTTHAPWSIIEANDKRWAQVEAFRAIVDAVEGRLKKLGKLPPEGARGIVPAAPAPTAAKKSRLTVAP